MVKTRHSHHETIFLSHSSADKPIVEAFFKKLKLSDLRIWFDTFDIVPGEVIIDKIDEGIADSQILLLFVSEASLRSSWVKYEWTTYISRKLTDGRIVYLIPIIIGNVKPPSSLSSFRHILLDSGNMAASIKETASAINNLVRKIAEEKKGFETLQLIDREKLIDREMTIVERHITLRTLGNAPIDLDFHQWQTNPGQSSIIRTSVVDNNTQRIIPSVLTVVEHTPTNFHLSNRFEPSKKHEVITAFFELSCKNYHKDVFKLGYSQIDSLIRYPIHRYAYIFEVPLKSEFKGIVLEAVRNAKRTAKKVTVKDEDRIMDRIFRFELSDLFPMEELTIVIKMTNARLKEEAKRGRIADRDSR